MTTFRRVLVTLDGSELAERGLDLLRAVGPAADRHVSLLTVVPPGSAGGPDEAAEAVAREYLEARLQDLSGTTAEALVRSGEDVAAEILEVADEGYDLVVLMTNGRSGLSRWRWGSVAERVVRHAPVPVLLGNAHAAELPGEISRILVPLDGSERAEAILESVRHLADDHGAEVVLVSAFWLDPHHRADTMGLDTDAMRAESEAYLEARAAELESRGIDTATIVALNRPAELVLKAVESTEADLVAMTTHGRSGVRRWVLGSVAEKVLRASPVPVLLERRDV